LVKSFFANPYRRKHHGPKQLLRKPLEGSQIQGVQLVGCNQERRYTSSVVEKRVAVFYAGLHFTPKQKRDGQVVTGQSINLCDISKTWAWLQSISCL